MSISNHHHYVDQSFEKLHMDQDVIETSEFINCRFNNCNFSGLHLQEARIINCEFISCDLSLLQVPNSSFAGVIFSDSKLIGVDWTRANWVREVLGNSLTFNKSILSHSTFIGLTLKGVKFVDCVAHNVDFRETDLSQSDFSGTDLTDSLFHKTNLTMANLELARNYQISPELNKITKARFAFPEALSLLYSMDIQLEGDARNNDEFPA